MGKYSKAVSETCSQFKQSEAHPMEKYIGRHVTHERRTREVVGYTTWCDGLCSLIVGGYQGEGWTELGRYDVVFKECESYWYTSIDKLID